MILDMNIHLHGIDAEFLDNLDELIDDTRVEYFIINPTTFQELKDSQAICIDHQRIKYTVPLEFQDHKDNNCVAIRVTQAGELSLVKELPLVIHSKDLNDSFIEDLNHMGIKGVVLDAKESDNRLINFNYAISNNSLQKWSKKGLTQTEYNKLALQSNYPNNSYDELTDGLLKNISDLTFRAEQTIASAGTRTVLRTFGLLY